MEPPPPPPPMDSPPSRAEAESRAMEREADLAAASEVRWPSCAKSPGTGVCGMIYDELGSDEGRAKFIRLHCRDDDAEEEPVEEPSESCVDRYNTAYAEALARRYPLADPGKVEAYCQKYPEQCETMLEVEAIALRMHNAWVRHRHEERLAGIEEIRQAGVAVEREERALRGRERALAEAERARRVFRAIAAGMQLLADVTQRPRKR